MKMSEPSTNPWPSGWTMERREVVYVHAAEPTLAAPLAGPRAAKAVGERPSAVIAIVRTSTRLRSAKEALSEALLGLTKAAPGFVTTESKEVPLPDGSTGHLFFVRLEPAPGHVAIQLHLARLDGSELVHGTATVDVREQRQLPGLERLLSRLVLEE